MLIYAIGSTAQCQFAQGDQIAFAKKMFNGAFRLPGNIDFTFFQPLTQIVRGQVHQHHVVGGIEKRIGHGFPYLNSGDAADHIIQTFQMLNVDGCENINASFQQLFDVLPAFRMTRTWRITVRQFVH
ncbi:hypothetical protein ExPCM20_00394 [Escherichia coli]|nr:hypothetical protein ExPCM20_00394 [Escherichia coli]